MAVHSVRNIPSDDKFDNLCIVSFNMHGFQQGLPVVTELLNDKHVDILAVQEHWLTPANLCKFNTVSADYFTFGSSAMSKCVESGMLVGRPFGGVMFLIRNELRHITELIYAADRYVIVRVANWLVINVHMPCTGTDNRQLIIEDVSTDAWSWRERFAKCTCMFVGDFNVDVCSSDAIAKVINSFVSNHDLINCDKSANKDRKSSYINTQVMNRALITCTPQILKIL